MVTRPLWPPHPTEARYEPPLLWSYSKVIHHCQEQKALGIRKDYVYCGLSLWLFPAQHCALHCGVSALSLIIDALFVTVISTAVSRASNKDQSVTLAWGSYDLLQWASLTIVAQQFASQSWNKNNNFEMSIYNWLQNTLAMTFKGDFKHWMNPVLWKAMLLIVHKSSGARVAVFFFCIYYLVGHEFDAWPWCYVKSFWLYLWAFLAVFVSLAPFTWNVILECWVLIPQDVFITMLLMEKSDTLQMQLQYRTFTVCSRSTWHPCFFVLVLYDGFFRFCWLGEPRLFFWELALIVRWRKVPYLLFESHFLNMAGAQSHKRKVAFPAVSLRNPSQSLVQPAVCCHTPANILITQQAYTFSFKLIQVGRFEPPQLKTNVIILSTQAHSRNKHEFINLTALASPEAINERHGHDHTPSHMCVNVDVWHRLVREAATLCAFWEADSNLVLCDTVVVRSGLCFKQPTHVTKFTLLGMDHWLCNS